jgi:ABC-type sugar transport system substrate-binding protein
MKTVALLLDDRENLYQQFLASEAQGAAGRHGARLLAPDFASGSAWAQLETINAHLRRETPPDAILIMLAAGEPLPSLFERVVKTGIAVVFLNRIPPWLEDLRKAHADALLAGVTPRQESIGEIQARHALRLAPKGAFALLVTGDEANPTAIARKQGFLDAVAGRLQVHCLNGRWSAQGAERAVADWLRLGAWRERPPALVVCHNDAMSLGVRKALARYAAGTERAGITVPPFLGCDGLAEEGQAMVKRGDLVATVVVPPTTPTALEILGRYWTSGIRTGTVFLEPASFPALA